MKQPVKSRQPEYSQRSLPPDGIEQQIARAIGSIRFGSVEITVHEGRVVQIEKREKVRLDSFRDSQSKPTAGAWRPPNIQSDQLTGPPEASHETNTHS